MDREMENAKSVNSEWGNIVKRLGQLIWIVVALLLLVSGVMADEAKTNQSGANSLDDKVQSLKKEVMNLNRDLLVLQEELLFPTSTQVAVFLSIDVGNYFRLDSVQLKIDDKIVANHLYTKQEDEALGRGGVQRLYLGNVKKGARELVAVFRGPGPNGREYKRATTHTFEKGSGPKYIELKITDVTRKLQPEFVVKEWE